MHLSLFFFFVSGFVIGSIAGEFFVLPIGIGAAALSFILPLLRQRRGRFVGLALLGCLLAVIRWSTMTSAYHGGLLDYQGRTVDLVGTVLDQPEMIDDQQRIFISQLTVNDDSKPGKVQAKLRPWPRYAVGDRLTLSCQLMAFPDVSQRRQWSHNVRAYCRQPHVRDTAPATGWRVWLAQIRDQAIRTIHRNFSEPQSSLLAGILLGTDEGMSDDLRQQFRQTGTTHIIALSGFNVTIIISVVMNVAVSLIGRRRAWIPALLFVVGFIVMTGASASVTRAGLMSTVSVLALAAGRPVAAYRALGYSFILMVWHNPFILRYDLGFQLSFLATAGLMYLSGPVGQALQWISNRGSLRENLATTLAAMLATQPLLLSLFPQLSLIAPAVNMLVLPLVPMSMALGGVTLLLGQLPIDAASLVAPATDAVLRLILSIIGIGGSLPLAAVTIPGLWTAAVGCGTVICCAMLIKKYAHTSSPA